MRIEIFKIEDYKKYNFIIGTPKKPDSDLKDKIRTQISEAMEIIEREPEDYSVSIVKTEIGEPGDTELPTLERMTKYLIFALLGSESGEARSDQELKEEKEEIAQGLNPIIPDSSKGALVLLYDCTVKVIEGNIDSSNDWIELERIPSKWDIDGMAEEARRTARGFDR